MRDILIVLLIDDIDDIIDGDDAEDGTLTGMVYIMDPRMDFGNPSKSYYDIVRQGYADCGLDTAVLDQAVSDSIDLAQQRMEGMRFF